jgi:hypothetical protein
MVDFDPNDVIEDAYVAGYDSAFDIQSFLSRHRSFLASYSFHQKSVADWLHRHCAEADIDARVILIRFQVEQSLITGSRRPSQHTLDWALGFGASDGGRDERYRGIDAQIAAGVGWWRRHWEGATAHVGKAFPTSDGRTVHPKNRATYLHYLYTPWVGTRTWGANGVPFGNYLVWLVKRRLFEAP